MKKYLNTISAFQFFQLLRYSTLILIGIVFTKTTLTQTAIGEYETFVFIAGVVSFFWLNGLLKALLPLSSETENTGQKTIFSAFVVIQIFSVLAALLLYFLQPFFSGFLLNDKAIPEINLLLLFVVVGVPANLVEYYYLIKKQNKAILIYGLLSFFVQFVLVVLPVLFGYGIQLALKGLVLSSLLKYVWLSIVFITKREISFSKDFVKEHLNLGGPLIAATLLSGSAQFVDGFIVTSKFDEETFAVFRYGARELPLAMLLANALSSAMLPAFANKENLHENLRQLKKSVSKLMQILFPITAVLLIVSKPVFPVLFNPDFTESATIFNIYLLLVISRLLMPQTILNGLKISKPILSASFLELVLNVVLSLVFVQFWGIAGIAMATFIAYLFEKIYLVVLVRRKLNIQLSEYLSIRNYTLYSFGIIVIFIFTELIF
ncbi:oligosaccharide flippase family protein [uncultured Draconibacterium sp.]|uniref:oligosaccharide flippase family protein n=1 Tax=uncultured Draconibacterium sp. TaxID=1573823 RepID=UPI0032175E9B